MNLPWSRPIAAVALRGTIGMAVRAEQWVPFFDGLRRRRSVKAVVVEIDSPGGTVSASDYGRRWPPASRTGWVPSTTPWRWQLTRAGSPNGSGGTAFAGHCALGSSGGWRGNWPTSSPRDCWRSRSPSPASDPAQQDPFCLIATTSCAPRGLVLPYVRAHQRLLKNFTPHPSPGKLAQASFLF